MKIFALLFLTVLSHVAVSAAPRVEDTVVVKTKPRFEQQGKIVNLVISDTNHSFTIVWGLVGVRSFLRVSLDTNQVYTFTVAQIPDRFGGNFPEVRKVQLGGETIYDPEVCEVHKVKMEDKEVPIVYGLVLPGPGEPPGAIAEKLFPNRHERALGGCSSSPDSPTTTHVYVCPDCKKAYENWKKEHPKPK